MSGLLEADIDLGLESGAAAFDPLYCSPPTHARTHHPPEQTELLHHRAYSTPTDIKRLVCSCSAQSSCPFHMSHLLASSPLRGSTLRPLRSPCERSLRRSVSSILPLTRSPGRRFTQRLASSAPIRERSPCLSFKLSRDLVPAHPGRAGFSPLS